MQPRQDPYFVLKRPVHFLVPRDTRLFIEKELCLAPSGVARRGEVVLIENYVRVEFDHQEQLALKLSIRGSAYFLLVKEISDEVEDLMFQLRQAESSQKQELCDELRAQIQHQVIMQVRARLSLVDMKT